MGAHKEKFKSLFLLVEAAMGEYEKRNQEPASSNNIQICA